MSAQPQRHLSKYRHRLQAAQVASRVLMSRRRELDRVTRQELEGIVFQRDDRLDVLERALKLEREGGVANG